MLMSFMYPGLWLHSRCVLESARATPGMGQNRITSSTGNPMAKITPYQGYSTGRSPTIPKPSTAVDPIIVTVQEGVPVAYPNCYGIGVRIIHPMNPRATSKNMSLTMFYVPPHAVLPPGSHETEETYVILEGRGRMRFANFEREVSKGDFVYLPPWCEHGIENTGTESLVVLIATSPPNP